MSGTQITKEEQVANPRLQGILASRVGKVAKEHSVVESRAFLQIMLSEIWDLDDISMANAITDGGQDKGIDALFEQEDQDGISILHVVQSKYYLSKPDKPFEEDGVRAVLEGVQKYILGDCPLVSLNPLLRKRVEDYRNQLRRGAIDQIRIDLVTNGQKPAPDVIAELESFRKSDSSCDYAIISQAELIWIFRPDSAKPVGEIELAIAKDPGYGHEPFLPLPSGTDMEGRVVKVDLAILAQVIQRNPNIFNSNVRVFRGMSNRVNKDIYATLGDTKTVSEFVYLNNGITILCDEVHSKAGGCILSLRNPSIINGCQTASVVSQAFNAGLIKENEGFVLARVLESTNSELKQRIIRASNYQTSIGDRDLRAEDDIQKELERQFAEMGYYYARKKGQHSDKETELVVDMEEAAQAYLALYLRHPSEAKTKKNEIWGFYYKEIFGPQITAQKLLVAWRLLREFEALAVSLKPQVDDFERQVLGNGVLHCLPLFWDLSLSKSNKSLQELEDNPDQIPSLMAAGGQGLLTELRRIVQKLRKQTGSSFNVQYFFKSSDSLTRLLEPSDSPIIVDSERVKTRFDFRYYKPYKFSLGGEEHETSYWNTLLWTMVNRFGRSHNWDIKRMALLNAQLNGALSADRPEGTSSCKRLDNGWYLDATLDAKKTARCCFYIADKLGLELRIWIRATPAHSTASRKPKAAIRRESKTK